MLTKSAARAFFLVGTAVCSIAFIGLSIDSFAQIPALTHSENITPAVARGKEVWEERNCMGCHTLFGEGAYYAPELTRVIERRGPEFVRAMLRDPESMYPGQRRMKNYKFNEADIDALVAFFEWTGEVNLQGFPPRPTLMPIAVPANNAGAGVTNIDNRPLVFNRMCTACHALDGQGGTVGPSLDLVGDRFDADYIKKWLRDPLAVKADSRMPKLPLTEEQIQELSAFLSQRKTVKDTKEPTPAEKEPMPAVKEPTPAEKEPMPAVKDATP